MTTPTTTTGNDNCRVRGRLILGLALLVVGGIITIAEASCDVDPNGTFIEAENYVPPLVPGAGSGSFLLDTTQAGFSGTGYLFSSGGDQTEPPVTERADYTVNFPTTGLYTVWMRGYATDTDDNSLFIGLDGTSVGSLREDGVFNQWIWTDNNQFGTNQINIVTAGIHTINAWVREPDHRFDALYLTQNPSPIPGGPSVGIPTGATIIDPNACSPQLVIIKVAFQPDGSPIPTGASIPSGVEFKFMLYINNTGLVLTDLSVRDILDPAFVFQAGTIQMDNSVGECAASACTSAEELAIFNAVNGAPFLTDGTGDDVASYTGAGLAIDAGNENAANVQLDINANAVWAIMFSVRMP